MANQPRKNEAREDLWKGSLEQDYLESERGPWSRALDALRGFYMRLSRRRNFPRVSLTFTDPMLMKLSLDDQEVDVAPCDISQGGMGIDVPGWLLENLKVGQNLSMRLSFDGKKWQEILGEIRYVRPGKLTRGSVGIQFLNPSPGLREAIVAYQKARPGRI